MNVALSYQDIKGVILAELPSSEDEYMLHISGLLSPGDAEKIRQLEETVRGLTKDLHNMQTSIHGIDQRLYVNVFSTSCSFTSWSLLREDTLVYKYKYSEGG